MPGAANFFGKPIGATPGDFTFGEVDGAPISYTPSGIRYYEQYQPPQPVVPYESLSTALDAGGRAIHNRTPKAPSPIRDMMGGVVEGITQGLTAPGRALRGEPVTYGDAWATALDYGVGSAPTRAPDGALRSGGIKAYHGSPHDFDKFSLDESMSDALWFSSDKGYAEGLAGRTNLSRRNAGHVFEVDLNVKNPLEVDVPNEVARYADEAGLTGMSPEDLEDAWRGGDNFESMVDFYRPDMEAGGNDAIVFRGTFDGYPRQTDQFVVFDEDLISIVRKYGIAGAAAYLGMPEDEIRNRVGEM